ncbi:unnamed protein product [Ceratitis capitata]|uniref:(Mediterranean fruit fly) hypothetical protein n=1 Tax=Ceratitis capitata TaxID=7213 RepID=A0A811V8Z9_CERCA|nr:unnamed protein product [Ceratitis capitata]
MRYNKELATGAPQGSTLKLACQCWNVVCDSDSDKGKGKEEKTQGVPSLLAQLRQCQQHRRCYRRYRHHRHHHSVLPFQATA